MTYPKMKPCEKCGGGVDLWTYESGWSRVECRNPRCDFISSCEGTKLQAIRAHNNKHTARSAPDQRQPETKP